MRGKGISLGLVASIDKNPSGGSRTTGYLVAGLVATIPTWLILGMFLGLGSGAAAVAVCWATGLVWLAKQRQEDPEWDRRSTASRRD